MVFIEALQSLQASVTTNFPLLVYAVAILVVGYIAGKIGGSVVRRLLERAKVDQYADEEHHLAFKTSSVLATITKWAIYIVAFAAASETLGIAALTNAMTMIYGFLPGVIGAVVVLIASYAIGIYVKEHVVGKGRLYTSILGKTLFFFILYMGLATALPILGIEAVLINAILLVIVASLGLGLALAIGLGLKDVVADIAKSRAQKYKKR